MNKACVAGLENITIHIIDIFVPTLVGSDFTDFY